MFTSFIWIRFFSKLYFISGCLPHFYLWRKTFIRIFLNEIENLCYLFAFKYPSQNYYSKNINRFQISNHHFYNPNYQLIKNFLNFYHKEENHIFYLKTLFI